MTRCKLVLLLTVVFISIQSVPAEAQRRGGGGRGGGRGGGGFSSSSRSTSRPQSRPSSSSYRGNSSSRSSANRSSSLNRGGSSSLNRGSASNLNRGGASNLNRGSASNLNRGGASNLNRGGASGLNRGGASNLNRGASGSNRSAFQAPSRSQLDSFLGGGSKSGSGGARTTGSANNRPSQPSRDPGWNSKTYETKNGTTITVGGGVGGKQGENGGGIVGGGKGVKIETANGKTFTKGGVQFGAGDGQGNNVRGGAAGKKASDGKGNSVGVARGGAVDSQGNFKGGTVGGAKNQWGYAKVGGRGATGNLNSGVVNRGAAGAVKGPYGNVISGGRGATFVNGQFVGGQTWSKVNGNYRHYNYFRPGYYGRYPTAWWPGKWAVRTTAWAAATWAVAGSYCGCSDEGVYYDYGESVTYEEDGVYYEGEKVASEEEYYDQANDIAGADLQSNEEEWLPLGIFAIVDDPEQTETERVVQLALNKSGEVKGNVHDVLLDKVVPISGSVDKKSQRVALKIDGNDKVIIEVGLYNLTNDEVPVLVHLSKENRKDIMFVRLQDPEAKEGNDQGGSK